LRVKRRTDAHLASLSVMEGTILPILWTFEDQEKLVPFVEILKDSNISYELLSKDKRSESNDGLIVSVDENDFKRAKKLLLSHRKRISNRHNK
jgi:hypothetical protein